ncbi:MAG: RNA polymerase sigma factor [Anaerolineales bacterium]|nr:RNA polymerase sigma factor [Anaerolineales bacterium]
MSSPTVWKRFSASAETTDWDALYTEHLPRVYNFFRYRTGVAAVAEDLTSATFEKAWRHRERYRRDLAAFATWLFSIARNVAADFFRRERPTAPLEEANALPGEEAPEVIVQQRLMFARLAALLAQLPERERELIALKYGAELNNREIAKLTGLSESNVGTVLSRAVQKLRTEWEPEP